jgi:hypothetical protein
VSDAEELDDVDAAMARFDEAEAHLEQAVKCASECPHQSPSEYEASLDRVERKRLEQSGWMFGKT